MCAEVEPRVSDMLGKCFTTELHSQFLFFSPPPPLPFVIAAPYPRTWDVKWAKGEPKNANGICVGGNVCHCSLDKASGT